ncbi:Hypothetical protein (Fragment) [Durusdinium trenchii]|uniref:Uncharacterized protein n=1 Tax=Durusdinium trenchii TaxID=1381693 RepID=A0ABP0MI36_9DINO
MAEALLEASVQNFRIRHPEVRILKCGQGIYDVQGRRIKLETRSWSLDPLVVDGPLRQPLSDYIAGSSRNESWEPPLVQSALHALPQARRVSFEELYPQNRTDAMRLAVLEANARERHAKEQLSRSPSPDRRHVSRPLSRSSSRDHRSSRSPLSRSPAPMFRPVGQPFFPVPVIFGTAPRAAGATPLAAQVVPKVAPQVAQVVPQVAQMPMVHVVGRGKEKVRQRSVSPSPGVRGPVPVPGRMGLAELKEAFRQLKQNTATMKHQLHALQARAIEELTKGDGEITQVPSSEPLVDEGRRLPGSPSAFPESFDPHLAGEKPKVVARVIRHWQRLEAAEAQLAERAQQVKELQQVLRRQDSNATKAIAKVTKEYESRIRSSAVGSLAALGLQVAKASPAMSTDDVAQQSMGGSGAGTDTAPPDEPSVTSGDAEVEQLRAEVAHLRFAGLDARTRGDASDANDVKEEVDDAREQCLRREFCRAEDEDIGEWPVVGRRGEGGEE